MHISTRLSLAASLLASTLASPVVPPADHPFIRANPTSDSRSPCPALNALANHGYLPHDGKNITAATFSTAIQSVYNIDPTLASTLSAGVSQVAPPGASAIDLADLNTHDKIEHDASLTRLDFAQGDNHNVQPKLVDALIADAANGSITIESLGRSRARREAESKAAGQKALGVQATTLAYGEAALLLLAMGKEGASGVVAAAPADVRAWVGEERLPEGYTRPVKAITSSGLLGTAGRILAAKPKV
ncbi:Cloroperoxidase [Trichodelitschia bisporula]|uniref:Cloroperoxidase n=1 Tax=Trichodelitschia bisporula TaxID=703511 RepID=A0A6G1HRL3_9PEZI|nr:Cloroperoxidase [Trichodelitschia bisporula]